MPFFFSLHFSLFFCVVHFLFIIINSLFFRDFTYILHLEAINSLLVLLSIQMFSTQPAEKLRIYK